MPVATNPTSPTAAGGRDFLVFLLCLVSVLAVLFHKSFEPDQILFSNDGPLGPNRSQAEYALSHFKGYWQDLNWIGVEYPGFFLDFSGCLMTCCCTFSSDFGPVLLAKIYAPAGLFILGLSTWFLIRQLRFRSWVCALGGLAAALNTTAFSPACWGLPTWTLAWAMNCLALAFLSEPSIRHWTLRAALAGFAVGLGVMEGFDVGAIFSLFTAAFAFLGGMTTEDASGKKALKSLAVVAVMTVCAVLIAAQAISSLVGTQVLGIVGMAQDEATKQQRWDEATMGSLPKAETLRVIIPGLFGYRIPELYGEPAQTAGGSNYWGAVGQTPGVLQSRHSGMGVSAGVVVVLVALFGIAQSFRKGCNAFVPVERKQVWCWLALLIVSLLLAWGRHGPLYRLAYALPYFSTIRTPLKFMFPFSLALVVLFGYGLEGLWRLYLDKAAVRTKGWKDQLKAWWKTAPAFDRKWTTGCIVGLTASLLGWLIYAASKNELIRFLQQAGFPDRQYPRLAESIALFSIGEAGFFILFLGLSIGLLTLILSGAFAGPRSRWAVIALGLLLVIDLGRADTPWIFYWNYKQKYASNPIIDFLREKPFERRVTAELLPFSRQYLIDDAGGNFPGLYFEWLQHHFQYYRIQSLDIIQMSRVPEFDKACMLAFRPTANDGGYQTCSRLWQLTNTRYVFGTSGFLQFLNAKVDPLQHRFRVHTNFNIVVKPGVTTLAGPEPLTAAPHPNGQFALFEFTGALPRVKVFAHWQVNTNDAAMLERLRSPDFDPAQSVLVAGDLPTPAPTNSISQAAGTAEVASYEPKKVLIEATAPAPSVLLLNDRFDPDWKVFVDGKPETVLRCNYMMRGVFLSPGSHRVEFRFQPPLNAFYVSLASFVAGVGLCGFLAVSSLRKETPSARPAPKPATAVKQ